MTNEVNILMHMNILKVQKNNILFALKYEQVVICLDSKNKNYEYQNMNNKMK